VPSSADLDVEYAITSARQFRRFALAVSLIGVLLQFALSTYYLEVGHAPRPRDVPVGVIGSAQQRQPVVDLIDQQGGFRITVYDSVAALSTAVAKRRSFGGLDVSGPTAHLYVSTAAGPTAATYMRTAFTTAVQQRISAQVSQLVEAGQPVPAATVAALTTTPVVTDLASLPSSDKYGSALSFLVQALALGGTIASAGLGILIPKARRSLKRGIGHLATLAVYAAGSAAAVLVSMMLFGIGGDASKRTGAHGRVRPHLAGHAQDCVLQDPGAGRLEHHHRAGRRRRGDHGAQGTTRRRPGTRQGRPRRGLLRHNLIDEYRLYVHPIVIGQGKPPVPRIRRQDQSPAR
jgi:hypothetical protein